MHFADSKVSKVKERVDQFEVEPDLTIKAETLEYRETV
jgi:hypothetical protein